MDYYAVDVPVVKKRTAQERRRRKAAAFVEYMID